MPTHYLHLILAYQAVSDVQLSAEERSAFLLGAVAPDAVGGRQEKHRSHYAVRVGVTWGHSIGKFEHEFLRSQGPSSTQHWFYRGYRYHLALDRAWLRVCALRAKAMMIVERLVGRTYYRGLYRPEQSQFDAYHRSTIDPTVIQDAYSCLIRADRHLFPHFLDQSKLDAILEGLVSRLSMPTASRFDGRLIRGRDVERFMNLVSRIAV